MNDQTPLISFVILTWNSESTIGDCLDAVSARCGEESISHEIFVVDNGSCDGTIGIVERLAGFMPITLERLPKNRGTTIPRNMALKKACGRILCVLDSDAVIVGGSLRALVKQLDDDPRVGILAPKLVFPEGGIQESVRKFPSALGKFGKIPYIVLRMNFHDTDTYEGFPFTEPAPVDYAISACWFLRRDILGTVGYLDENIFYAPEDIDYGIRVWAAGMHTLYYPDVVVAHHIQRLTHKKILSRIALSHFLGLVYYFRKHRYLRTPAAENVRQEHPAVK